MKQPVAIILLSLLCWIKLSAAKPVRTYHDIPLSTADSLIVFDAYTQQIATQAVEIRASCASGNEKNADKANAYGIAFAIGNDGSYYAAILSPGEDDEYDDLIDSRHAVLTITRRLAGKSPEKILVRQLTKGMEVQKIENTLAVEIDCMTGLAEILAGDNTPEKVAKIQLTAEEANNSMGIIAIGNPAFLLTVSELRPDPKPSLTTGWTTDSLMAYLNKNTTNQVEGIWKYLDRDTDSRYCRLGGEYTVAIIADGNSIGYDIIYLDGAQTARSAWQPGMIKGHLSPTQFLDHYDLVWYDATMNRINTECSATMEQNAILRLDFPLLKATMRMAKHPDI